MSAVSRRRFLATTALAGGSLLTAQAAGAFTVQPMDAETHKLYASACGGPEAKAYHQQLLLEARAQLPADMSSQDIETAIAALACPICGCKLAS
jgi:hypothetical protein